MEKDMNVYVTKKKFIKAKQWFPEDPIEGVELVPVKIRFSIDEEMYYVTDYQKRATAWIAVKESDDGKFNTYPFSMYSIRSGKEVLASEMPELYKRHMELYGWTEESMPYGIIRKPENRREFLVVKVGDYVVQDGDTLSVVGKKEFEDSYDLQ